MQGPKVYVQGRASFIEKCHHFGIISFLDFLLNGLRKRLRVVKTH